MSKPCQVDGHIASFLSNTGHQAPKFHAAGSSNFSRRGMLRRSTATIAGLTCADFLAYFAAHGMPGEQSANQLAADAERANEDPHFLVYWYLEGGWCGYDMFNPVNTENNVLHRLENISDERYRVLGWGQDDYSIQTHGNIRYGYLAEPGKHLFQDMAVVSSMHTGSGHSRDRLKVHMGSYNFKQTKNGSPTNGR